MALHNVKQATIAAWVHMTPTTKDTKIPIMNTVLGMRAITTLTMKIDLAVRKRKK